jgi:hypothetical protein
MIIQNVAPLALAQNIGIRGEGPRRTLRTVLRRVHAFFFSALRQSTSQYNPRLERVQRIEVV